MLRLFFAQKVIITLPLALLQANAVKFEPVLPPEKRRAIAGLGSGHITKLILKFDKPFWSQMMDSFATTLDTHLWYRPGWRRIDESPVLTAYTSASGAEALGKLGREGAITAGLRDLEQMFGMKLRDRLVDALFADWQVDPFSRMAYSYVPVNGVGLRSRLATPVENVLFFAGEATHVTRPATVHGAIKSGLRAAKEIFK